MDAKRRAELFVLINSDVQAAKLFPRIELRLQALIEAAEADAIELAAQLCEARAAGVQDAIDEGGSTPALAEMVSQFSSLAESIRATARQQDKGART